MSITASQRTDAYRFFAIAFGAAPGVEYFKQLTDAYEYGLTTKQVVNIFTTKSQFTSVYATTLSNETFADRLVENVVGSSATAEAKAAAKADVEGALDVGWTRGDIIYQIFSNLAAKSTSDATWGGTSQLMKNQVTVAQYVTEAWGLNTTDLTTLKNSIAGVTATTNLATTDAIKAVLTAAGVTQPSATVLTSSNDTWTGTAGNDSVDGGVGADTLRGGDGNDVLIGGSGDDRLYGERGQDYIEGGDGADLIELGAYYTYGYVSGYYDANRNWIDGYYVYTVEAGFDTADGGNGSDTITGGYGSDLIYGGAGADRVYGDYYEFSYYDSVTPASDGTRILNDTIYGGSGDDTVYGYNGNDVIFGEAGNDNLDGGYWSDYVDGGDGNDTLYGGGGWDTLIGGSGNDTLYVTSSVGGGLTSVDAGVGDDLIYFYASGDEARVKIVAGAGSDYVSIYTQPDAQFEVDLTESAQAVDTLSVKFSGSTPLNPINVTGWSLASDRLELESFDLFGSNNYSYGYVQDVSRSVVTRSYAQAVDNPNTAWIRPTGTGVDAAGKGFFIIKGAKATGLDTTTVAAFLDPYGNNATYANKAKHYFAFDVAINGQDVGMAIYRFVDDTGADNLIVADELAPLVLLTGISTAQLDTTKVGFFNAF